jgi:hypothetical protein
MTGMVSAGFGVGFAMGKPVLWTALGLLAGAGAVAVTLTRGSAADRRKAD